MVTLDALDADSVRRWSLAAEAALKDTESALNALNVFPVPDHDTGTNLYRTMRAAARSAESVPWAADPHDVWHALARGAVAGASGSSGVILSQFLHGLAGVCGQFPECDGPVLRR